MELRDSRDYAAPVGIVAVDELVSDVLLALAQSLVSRQNLHSFVEVFLCHAGVEEELAPDGTV